MYKNKRVSVIFPTYNEKDSIRNAIEDFFLSGYVDEIIVVNNNAKEGTSEEVAKTNALEVFEPRQGYGFAIRKGLDSTTADLIIISEPDGTFIGRDVEKLLSYSDDFEIILGTRTVTNLIREGANMGLLLRFGNIFVAKFMEVMFLSRSQFTDVGCTMRLITKKGLDKIKHRFSVGQEHFGPEMVLLAIIERLRYIEIPVNYRKRVGVSSVTGNKLKALFLGFKMIILILKYRISFLLK